MLRSHWRVYVELKSLAALLDFMTLRRVDSAYELARIADLGVGITGHLVAGRRKTCSPETAAKIEGALKVDPGVLFEPKMLPVVGSTQRRRVAA